MTIPKSLGHFIFYAGSYAFSKVDPGGKTFKLTMYKILYILS